MDALLNSLMLWVVAAFLAWKGILVFLSRGEPSPVSPPPAPGAPQEVPDALASSSAAPGDSPRTDHPDELGEFVKEFKVFVRRIVAVCLVFLLVPVAVISAVTGLFLLSGGEVLGAGAAFLLAGGLAWCCWGLPLRKLWARGGGAVSQVTEDHTTVPGRLSLPEEILLLSYKNGTAHDRELSAAACAGAELGELVLRRRVRITARKSRLFGVEVYVGSGAIRVLDSAPTGLAWADELLAEVERLETRRMPFAAARTGSETRPVSVGKWLRSRGDKALLLHREALTERRVLLHSPGRPVIKKERHHPDPAVRNELIGRLRAVSDGRVPLDERMLLLLNLVAGAGLSGEVGLDFDHVLKNGVLPEEMRETGVLLAESVSERSRAGGGGGE